jgi:hypothetical protein
MADWVNNGSYQDLSSLAKDSMWPTSQAGGNMQSDADTAMTAPGSEPVDPLPDRDHQGDPHVEVPASSMPPGTDGKARAASGDFTPPPRPAWGKTTRPAVAREK